MQKKDISFEDNYHYPFTLTQKEFLIIDSQKKMDEVFNLIHQKNQGNRYAAIPTVMENETYIIIKPHLKNSNDVIIENINLNKNILYIKIKEFENPDFSKRSRISPNILLKLLDRILIKKIIMKH
ncbi:hypothetical protein [Chryseobacterium sp. MMS23-Vi53]|uniref:hypothetical protein n=1 Tax=Chryseobacterium sp. MMS23-Vi53 TaxID=3386644 RepID=UPI0039ED4436